MTPRLIGLDWGTTSCRAYLLGDGGGVLAHIVDGPGILRVENGAFGPALDTLIGGWLTAHGRLPVVLSGMIGSRQGWVEVPYARCPASAADVVSGVARIDHGGLDIAVVPGLSTESHGMPDVMRGEETQIFGALARCEADGLFLLPGTHSKWAMVENGRILWFRTFMTGEIFSALKNHTILGRLMRDGEPDAEAFTRGVVEGSCLDGPGALLHRLFATRTYGLTNQLPATALSDYLSGLLIGVEIAEALGRMRQPVTLVANPTLAARYATALGLIECRCLIAPDDCVAAGHWRIAVAAGLVKEGS